MKECVKRLWNTLKQRSSTSNCKGFCKSHHLQCIKSSKISVLKGQGPRHLMDAHSLWALRKHCITHRHDSLVEITKWAQEYFQKPLLVNNPHCRVLWAKAHWKCTISKWKSLLWSDESKFDILVGNHRCRVLRAKEEGDLPACYQHSVQKPAYLMVLGCISA